MRRLVGNARPRHHSARCMSLVLSDQTHIFKLATLRLVLAVDPLRLPCEVHESQLFVARSVPCQSVHRRLYPLLQLEVGRQLPIPLGHWLPWHTQPGCAEVAQDPQYALGNAETMTPVTPLELADYTTAPVQFLVACPEPDQQAAGSLVRKKA